MAKNAPTHFFDTVAPRKYLLPAEIELLMNHARKNSRYGHRDATMILIKAWITQPGGLCA